MLSVTSALSHLSLSDTSLGENEVQKEHAFKVLQLLNEHRKQEIKLCDVKIKVKDKMFLAHKSVLAACSSYFLAMFNGEMKESKQSMIELKDMDENILDMIIDFAYTGQLKLTTENVEKVLELATLLQFPEVCHLCCLFLKEQLEPTNCIGIRHFASLHLCYNFLKTIDEFITQNFCTVLNSEEFTSLPADVFKSILSSDNLNVDCEERVYIAIMKWVNFDLNERSKYFSELLAEARLPLFSIRFIMKYVDTEPLVRNCLKCRDLLDETKNYYIQNEDQANLRSIRTRPRFSTAGILFAVGGKEAGETITDKTEAFSLFDNTWAEKAPLNRQRQQLGVCELDGKIYAVGGSDGMHRLSSVEVYTPATDTWQDATPLQKCRSGVGVGVLGGMIYSLGGYDGRDCLDSVERFDPSSETWEYIKPISVTRSFPGVVSLYNRLYVIGGNDGQTFLSSCECYDPLTGKWTFITNMTSPRAGVGCAVLDGILYVAGGFDGSKRLGEVEMFEPRMNAWKSITPMNSFRDGVCMTAFGGYLFAIGGIDGPSYLNSIEYYDPTTKVWTDVVSMETSRAAAGVAVIKDDIVLEM